MLTVPRRLEHTAATIDRFLQEDLRLRRLEPSDELEPLVSGSAARCAL